MSSKISLIEGDPAEFKQELERIIALNDIEEIKWNLYDLSEDDQVEYGIGDEGAIILANWMKTNTSLKVLKIKKNNIGPIGMKAISEALAGNNILTELDLEENNIGDSDEGIKELSKTLTVNSSIRILNLAYNYIGDDEMKELSKTFALNSSIQSIVLTGNNFGDEGMEELSKALTINSSIIELDLGNNDIGDEGMKELSKSLTINSSIEALILSDNNIGDEGMTELSKALTVNSTIHTLLLSNNNIGDEGIGEFSKTLIVNSSIADLELGNNNIADEGMKELSKSLTINSSIEMLNLSDNNIGDESMTELSKSLSANASIHTLDLNNNKIGDEGMKELSKALTTNSSLQTLDLRNNKIGEEGMKELSKSIQFNYSILYILHSVDTDEYYKIDTICDRNKTALMLRQTAPLHFVKCIIVGPSRAGKTCIVNSLLGLPFVEKNESTVGLSVRPSSLHNKFASSSSSSSSTSTSTAPTMEKQQSKTESKSKEAILSLHVTTKYSSEKSKAPIDYPSLLGKMTVSKEEIESAKKKYEKEKKELDTESKDNYSKVTVMFYDCGGQDIYQTANELFLSQNCIAFVVFDMLELSQSKDVKRIEDWIQNIILHTPSSPIFLIGTRGDKVGENIIKEIDGLLRLKLLKIYKFITPSSSSYSFFPVNNELSDKDAGVQEIKRCLQEQINTNEIFKEEYLVTWLRILDDCMEASEDTKQPSSVMKLSELEEKITKKCGVVGDDVVKVCETFHRLGFLAYFNNRDSDVKDYVVLNPQRLIDAIAQVITNYTTITINNNLNNNHDKNNKNNRNNMLDAQLEEFNHSGIISRKILKYLWKSQMKLSEEECEIFCKMMIELNLMVEKYDERGAAGDDVEFIVPSKLPLSNEEESVDRMSVKTVRNIAYINLFHRHDANSSATNEFRVYPFGVFYRLLTKLCAVNQLTCDFKPKLSKNEALICIGDAQIYISSDEKRKRIKIVIGTSPATAVMHMIQMFMDEVMKDYFPFMIYKIDVEVVKEEDGDGDDEESKGNGRIMSKLLCVKDLQEIKDGIQKGTTIYYDVVNEISGKKESIAAPPQSKLFRNWCHKYGEDEKYDIFISYRVIPDSKSANLLHWCVMNGKVNNNKRTPRIFFDQYCLEIGKAWDRSFAMALRNSTVFVPLITQANLTSIEDRLNNNKPNEVDNVLLEWMLGMELSSISSISSLSSSVKGVIPVFEFYKLMYGTEKNERSLRLKKMNTKTNEECAKFLTILLNAGNNSIMNDERKARIMSYTVSDVYEFMCKMQTKAVLEELKKEIKGRYTDWKLYIQCGTIVRSASEKFIIDHQSGETRTNIANVNLKEEKHLKSLSKEELKVKLTELGLENFIPNFEKNNITGASLHLIRKNAKLLDKLIPKDEEMFRGILDEYLSEQQQ